MGFANLDSDAGVAILNDFIVDKSYIEGFSASQADVAVFEALKEAPNATKFVHAARWYSHVKSLAATFAALPGTKKAVSEYGPAVVAKKASADDDFELFGSDEEEDAEAEAAKAARLAEYQAKKAKKPAVIAKSSVVLDVKPWDDETDMAELEAQVRSISLDGLLWGASELVAIGYGIKKLRISCVVEDDKVGTDILEEHILGFEDHVQSMDIHSFNKV